MKAVFPLLVATACLLSACGDPGRALNAEDYPTRLVLAEGESAAGFHPATGHSQVGVSPIYDGLLRPVPSGENRVPTFAPALAAELPTPSKDRTTWTITLKEGITFHDGTSLDSADVKASYETAKNTDAGSEVAGSYEVIESIDTPDPRTVVFHLTRPLSDLAARLNYPIAPSEKVSQSPISHNELSQHPVGTGAYRFVERRGNDTIYAANENYWDGAPEVKELVVSTVADDSARGQRVLAGDFAGAIIPQIQAKNFEGKSGVTVDVAKGADWRAISLPAGLEPNVRRAMNLGTDRQALIDGPVAGYGSPESTPVGSLYGAAFEPSAVYDFNQEAAEALLDEAGWRPGPDGVRAKDGSRLDFPLFYTSSDTTRRDVAIEFASQMKRIGISVQPTASTWDEITPQMTTAAVVLAGGETPYDLSMSAYDQMHTRSADTSPYHNAGGYGSQELDRVLEAAVSEPNAQRNAELWRTAQQLYVSDPSAVVIGTIDHVYLSRSNSWKKPELQLEPHVHGATWGPWWRMSEWAK